jgi:hypothetical protein
MRNTRFNAFATNAAVRPALGSTNHTVVESRTDTDARVSLDVHLGDDADIGVQRLENDTSGKFGVARLFGDDGALHIFVNATSLAQATALRDALTAAIRHARKGA